MKPDNFYMKDTLLKEGDVVFSLSNDKTIIDWVVEEISFTDSSPTVNIWVSFNDIMLNIEPDGSCYHLGIKHQIFWRTKEEAFINLDEIKKRAFIRFYRNFINNCDSCAERDVIRNLKDTLCIEWCRRVKQ